MINPAADFCGADGGAEGATSGAGRGGAAAGFGGTGGGATVSGCAACATGHPQLLQNFALFRRAAWHLGQTLAPTAGAAAGIGDRGAGGAAARFGGACPTTHPQLVQNI